MDEKQKLVDIAFQVAIHAARYHSNRSDEEIAIWVANHLKQCGFPTQMIGLSWGILINA